jgi:hypothetical protein
MIEPAFRTSVHIEEQFQSPAFSTCQECHRTFRAKSEIQLSLELCGSCLEAVLHPDATITFVRVKVHPRRAAER